MYNLFDNIEEFNTWHQAVKDALGFPYREGDEIAASHEPKLSAQEALALGYFPTPLDPE